MNCVVILWISNGIADNTTYHASPEIVPDRGMPVIIGNGTACDSPAQAAIWKRARGQCDGSPGICNRTSCRQANHGHLSIAIVIKCPFRPVGKDHGYELRRVVAGEL